MFAVSRVVNQRRFSSTLSTHCSARYHYLPSWFWFSLPTIRMFSCYRALLLLCILPPWLAAKNKRGARVAGIMNNSVTELMEYNNYNTPQCKTVIKELGLLRRRRYIHRSSRRKFVYSRSGDTVPSIWTAGRSVASLPRHQSTDALWTSTTDGG